MLISDDEAEAFVASADLAQYELSLTPVRFEFPSEEARVLKRRAVVLSTAEPHSSGRKSATDR